MDSEGVWKCVRGACLSTGLPHPGSGDEWRFYVSESAYAARKSGTQAIQFRAGGILEDAPPGLLKRIERALLDHIAMGEAHECVVSLSDAERELLERASAASPAKLMIQEGAK